MNELNLRQRLEDGSDPTVMSLQRREERELYQTSHSFVGLLHSFFVPPPFSLSLSLLFYSDGLMLQIGDSPPPHALHSATPHPPKMLRLLSLLCPAQRCLFQLNRLWPRLQKIPISHPRSGVQAKAASNLVNVCMCVCVFVSV